jgi:cytochrome b6-f complex iron-sulfur subunit
MSDSPTNSEQGTPDESADNEPKKGSPEWKKQQGKHLAKAEKKRLKKQQEEDEGYARRSLLKYVPSVFGVAWATFAGGVGACSVAGARYMMPNVNFNPPQTFKAGYPAEYPSDIVETKYKASKRTWIIRTQNDVANKKSGFFALKAKCTHLGCTPNWLSSQSIFKCPCHGSGYYKSGINFEGPAPKPMKRFKIWLAADGLITVDKSMEFDHGQWTNPDAFLPASEAGLT